MGRWDARGRGELSMASRTVLTKDFDPKAAGGPDRVRAMPADHAEAARIARASGSSFFWAMRLLPRPKRQAMFGIYAFCREIDDIADAPGMAREERQRRLEAWRREVEALYAGRPQGAIARVLYEAVGRFGLERTEFEALIDGMRMDAETALIAPGMATLELYCRRVAVATGRLSVAVFGEGGANGRALADHLGRALQLTNILRDLDDDAALGRLYLPAELLERHGIEARTPAAVLAHPALDDVCRELAGEAEASFAGADALIARCDRRAVRPAIVMREVYGVLLAGLVRRGWRVRDGAIAPSRATKLWIALRHGLV